MILLISISIHAKALKVNVKDYKVKITIYLMSISYINQLIKLTLMIYRKY